MMFISLACLLFAALRCSGEYTATLPLQSTTYGFQTSLTMAPNTSNPTEFENVNADIILIDDSSFRLLLKPTMLSQQQAPPYSIPSSVFPASKTYDPSTFVAAGISKQKFKVDAVNAPRAGGATFFVSSLPVADESKKPIGSLHSFVYGTTGFNFTLSLPANCFLSGYGEHNYFYFLNHDGLSASTQLTGNETLTTDLSIWNTDIPTPWQDPMYGFQPVIFVSNPSQNFFYAFLFLNSHAQRISMTTYASNIIDVDFSSIGGTGDFWFLTGNSMHEVVQRYHTLITPTTVPPFWALGTHQCRWGYRNISMIQNVVNSYKNASIPLEVIWNDIDYMDQFRIFTNDPVRYPTEELQQFIAELHSNGQRYVQIVDPGVANAQYGVYQRGYAEGVYINKSTLQGSTYVSTDEPLVNVVWPGWTVFPDFTSAKTHQWWQDELQRYLAKFDVDGLWLDMNELGVFCVGQCENRTNWTWDWLDANWTLLDIEVCGNQGNCGATQNELNDPLYNPLQDASREWSQPIPKKTLDMTGTTSLGLYFDTKAFYAYSEVETSYNALKAIRPNTRPFLLSRSTFVGSGKYTAHWTGDNSANWSATTGGFPDSIQGVLSSNLWGVSMVGADIGGFFGTTTAELLTRWTQAGAFYTFMRNHHTLDTGPGQEPYLFGPRVIASVQQAINKRYELLPYIFTCLATSHFFGGSCLRHPSYEFSGDLNTYTETTNFLMGSSIFVFPVVEESASSVSGYLPTGTWYDLWTGSVVSQTGQESVTLNATLYQNPQPALVRGGSVIPLFSKAKMTVTDTRNSGVSILCAMAPNGYVPTTTTSSSDASLLIGSATGIAYFDDGADGLLPGTEPTSNNTALRKVAYFCSGSPVRGSVESVVMLAGPKQPQANENAVVTVWFPAGVPAQIAPPKYLVANGRYLDSSDSALFQILPLPAVGFKVTLPLWVDSSNQEVSVQWSNLPIRTASSSDNDSSEWTSTTTIVAIVAGVLLVGLGFAVLRIMSLRRVIQTGTAEYQTVVAMTE